MKEGKKVVLAVRQADEREAMTNLLESMEMQVLMAESAQDAVYMLEDNHCDLMVTDVQLPDMHAWRMLGVLKESIDLDSLPVVVIMDKNEVVPIANVTAVVRPISMAKLRLIIDDLLVV